METPPTAPGGEQSQGEHREPLPQNGPNTLIFQNTSSRMSIPLALLRLSKSPYPPIEENEGSDGSQDELQAYCLESKPADSAPSHSRSRILPPPSQTLEQPPPSNNPRETLGEVQSVLSDSRRYEALLHVLELLPVDFRLAVVPLVCKEWRDAAFDPACWSHVEVGEVRFREGILEAAREIFWEAGPRQIQGLVKKLVEKSAGQMQSFRATVPTTDTLLLLAAGCPNLRTLLVPRSFRAVTNDSLAALARACPRLTELDISGCLKVTEVGVIQVATFCQGLQRLSVAGNFQFSNWALASVAMNCRGLRSLDVSGCQRVRDDGLEILAAKCKALVALEVGGCREITDRGVCELARSCVNLENLGLGACKLLTDASVTAIAVNCPRLSVFNLSNVDSVTDRGIVTLAAHAAQLTDINVGGCFRITDQAVSAILGGCPKLSRISVRGCTKLSDASLTAIARRELYYLDVRGCRGMSDGLIRQVMQERNNQKRRLVSSYGL
ncbi:hypothetical protein KFL_004340100 [Klebsormidium nitens]|uniref:F-box domain-containing protein n=1 Tax=Klebsormidium nitens TaxID=105231 RepID=A0A1Y1ID30_KLENI|nr:hypothetical protein KFL_004340100 [Klebsormidium nitens]|eukprot:GAQ88503.1 hypothetical protein KFL_004340100 [Klebsormidium nitens]